MDALIFFIKFSDISEQMGIQNGCPKDPFYICFPEISNTVHRELRVAKKNSSVINRPDASRERT